jgi:uncharacterized SAM-binding protein YcdF (DUF218 family)
MGRILRIAVAVAVVLFLVAVLALRGAGRWLVVADPLQPASAIVVLGGQVPFRAMEAAAVYKDRWAREVWLTRERFSGEESALARMGIDRTPEEEYSRRVLERLNVPAEAIRILPEHNLNTADEIRAVSRRLQQVGGDRVILVTSKYHTRRVTVLWRTLVGRHPAAVVRYTRNDPFEADRWWHSTNDAMAVSREWFGLLNAWTGFPVKAERW